MMKLVHEKGIMKIYNICEFKKGKNRNIDSWENQNKSSQITNCSWNLLGKNTVIEKNRRQYIDEDRERKVRPSHGQGIYPLPRCTPWQMIAQINSGNDAGAMGAAGACSCLRCPLLPINMSCYNYDILYFF